MKWDCGYGICNGVAYWTTANQRDYLVSFDSGNKIFQALPPPKCIASRIEAVEEYKESICLLRLNMARGAY